MKMFKQGGQTYVCASLNGVSGGVQNIENPWIEVFGEKESFEKREVKDVVLLLPNKNNFHITSFENVWNTKMYIFDKGSIARAVKDLIEKIVPQFQNNFSYHFIDFIKNFEIKLVEKLEQHFVHYPLGEMYAYLGYNNYASYGNCFGITVGHIGKLTTVLLRDMYYEEGENSLVEDITPLDLYNDKIIHLVAESFRHA